MVRLKRKDHGDNLICSFEKFFISDSLTDVTIMCEGQMIKAHKVILASVSKYFKSLFESLPSGPSSQSPYPMVIIKEMTFSQLSGLLQFIYKGEVRIPKDEFDSFVKCAHDLGVIGIGNRIKLDQMPTSPVTVSPDQNTSTISPPTTSIPVNSNATTNSGPQLNPSNQIPVTQEKSNPQHIVFNNNIQAPLEPIITPIVTDPISRELELPQQKVLPPAIAEITIPKKRGRKRKYPLDPIAAAAQAAASLVLSDKPKLVRTGYRGRRKKRRGRPKGSTAASRLAAKLKIDEELNDASHSETNNTLDESQQPANGLPLDLNSVKTSSGIYEPETRLEVEETVVEPQLAQRTTLSETHNEDSSDSLVYSAIDKTSHQFLLNAAGLVDLTEDSEEPTGYNEDDELSEDENDMEKLHYSISPSSELSNLNFDNSMPLLPSRSQHPLFGSDKSGDGSRKHECPVCAKLFSCNQSMKTHLKGEHLNQRHVCYICGEVYKWQSNLSNHMKKHKRRTEQRPVLEDSQRSSSVPGVSGNSILHLVLPKLLANSASPVNKTLQGSSSNRLSVIASADSGGPSASSGTIV